MRKRSQKRNLDREIARAIFNAQVASDAGKGIFAFRHVPEPAVLGGYESKDVYVQKAIRLILASTDSVFRFSVRGGGFTPYLVYFEARLGDGWKYQVSFHSYVPAREERLGGITETVERLRRISCAISGYQFPSVSDLYHRKEVISPMV
jgi:hypothetical protein